MPLDCGNGRSNAAGPLGETKGTGNAGQGNPGWPSASSTSPRRLPVWRSTKVMRFPPSSVRWLSALPMMNMSRRSTSPTDPKCPVSTSLSSASAVLSCWRLIILLTFMTAMFPRPPCCRNSALSVDP